MKTSENLKIIEKDGKYYVYHKMYGNLTLMDKEVYEMLLNTEKHSILTKEEEKIVDELSNNFFLNDLEEENFFDTEIEYRKNATDGRLLVGLQLVVSNFCNFNCHYCFLNEEHKLRDNSELNKPSNMDYSVAEEAINFMIGNLKKNGNNVLSIEFFGGEPLMNWTLIKEVLDVFGNGENVGIEIEYIITTNGSLINNEMIDYFEKYNISVIISYDSPNSRERLTKDNRELNDVLFPVLEKIKDKKILKSFNSVISKYTVNNYDFKGLIHIAKKYNIQNIGLILDLDADFVSEGCTIEDIIQIILSTYDYGMTEGINVTGYWAKMYQQINNKEDIYLVKGYKACPAVGCKISVEPSGDIFACKCCPSKIGEISTPEELLNGKEYNGYMQKVYKNCDTCEYCELNYFCSGVCVGALEKKGSKYGKDNNLCYIYKKVTEQLIIRTPKEEISTILMKE